jgi:hypothetical protein
VKQALPDNEFQCAECEEIPKLEMPMLEKPELKAECPAVNLGKQEIKQEIIKQERPEKPEIKKEKKKTPLKQKAPSV